MRYELSDYEWTAIKPMLPNKPRGVRRVNDRRVLNGIFWVLRSGAPWRDLPEVYGPRTTCYNRFVRWRRAGVWDQIMDALAAGHDAAVQMIDTSVVRVHQHGACVAESRLLSTPTRTCIRCPSPHCAFSRPESADRKLPTSGPWGRINGRGRFPFEWGCRTAAWSRSPSPSRSSGSSSGSIRESRRPPSRGGSSGACRCRWWPSQI